MSPLDDSLQDDGNKYIDGPKWSSDAKVMTSSEMRILTSDYKMAINSIKMASDGKRFNIKVVRIVKSVDFDINIVLIRGRMQPVEAKQGQK